MSLAWPPIDDEIRAAVVHQLGTTTSIYDRSGVIARFEDSFAAHHHADFALLTSSGTAALHSAYYALGIGPGDEVLAQDYTFFATAMPVFQLGAAPVPVDVGYSGELDLDQAQALITPTTKALVATHMWGHPQRMRRLRTFCDRYGIALVEDCSHAHGASREGVSVGQLADAACWSLQGRKTITAGEGGILTTPHREVYEKAMLLGHFNKRAIAEVRPSSPLHRYAATGLGLKYRAHPLGLAMAEVYLARLDSWLHHRQRHAATLESVLANRPGVSVLTPTGPELTPTLYAFVFAIDPATTGLTRRELLAALHAHGRYEVSDCDSMRPLHTHAAFTHPHSPVTDYSHPLIRGPLPVAAWLSEHTLRVAVPAENTAAARRYIHTVAEALESALSPSVAR